MSLPFRVWLGLKPFAAKLADQCSDQPRAKIPPFASPEAVWVFLRDNFVYSGEWFDNYTHPEVLQAAMEDLAARRAAGMHMLWRIAVDCDDLALWVCRAIETIPGFTCRLVNLEDANGKASHAIAVFEGEGFYGAIDTSGLHWFDEKPTDAMIAAAYDEIFQGARYTDVVPEQDPFAP